MENSATFHSRESLSVYDEKASIYSGIGAAIGRFYGTDSCAQCARIHSDGFQG